MIFKWNFFFFSIETSVKKSELTDFATQIWTGLFLELKKMSSNLSHNIS